MSSIVSPIKGPWETTGVPKWVGRVIENASKVNLIGFILDHLEKDANVKTDFWSGYNGVERHFPKLVRQK